jgi:hypothetical protein
MENGLDEVSTLEVEYKLKYLMGETNYKRYKDKVLSNDKNKILRLEDLTIGLAGCMEESFYEELMNEISHIEEKIQKTYVGDPMGMQWYKKAVERMFELFGKALDAKETSPIYKIFKKFNTSIKLIIKTLLKKDFDESKFSPKEMIFVFNNRIALTMAIFEKFHLDEDFESKNWADVNTTDINKAVGRVLKEYINIAEQGLTYTKTTIH